MLEIFKGVLDLLLVIFSIGHMIIALKNRTKNNYELANYHLLQAVLMVVIYSIDK